jgi:DNA polymerase V
MTLTLLGRIDRLRNLTHECAELRITGFQSPAEDEKDGRLSFDELVGLGKPQVWIFKVDDDSLVSFGLCPGDRIAVDRAATCKPDCLAVINADGDNAFRLRMFTRGEDGQEVLMGPDRKAEVFEDGHPVEFWGRAGWVLSQLGW